MANATDLSRVEASAAPRSDELCRRLAGRIEPIFGFVAYGVLFFFVSVASAMAIGLPVMLGAVELGSKGAIWVSVVSFAAMGAGFVLPWRWFARWVKRRRGAAKKLVRDGTLVPARVIDRFDGKAGEVATRVIADVALRGLGGRVYRVALEHGDHTYVLAVPHAGFSRPAAGTETTVLFHEDARHALVFDPHTGRAQCAGVPRPH